MNTTKTIMAPYTDDTLEMSSQLSQAHQIQPWSEWPRTHKAISQSM